MVVARLACAFTRPMSHMLAIFYRFGEIGDLAIGIE